MRLSDGDDSEVDGDLEDVVIPFGAGVLVLDKTLTPGELLFWELTDIIDSLTRLPVASVTVIRDPIDNKVVGIIDEPSSLVTTIFVGRLRGRAKVDDPGL